MYRIGLLLFPGCHLSSLAGPMDAFQIANAHIRNQQGNKSQLFSWRTIGLTNQPVKTSGGIELIADTHINNNEHFDMIYIPGFYYEGIAAFEIQIAALAPAIT